jgi:zinc protease
LIDTELEPFRIGSTTRTLANGLRVVVHEDRSSPIVAVHLMVHAGSRHEPRGRTGLAHLLEHMLFEGTENLAKGGFDVLLEEVGGTSNGSTWLDRTNYFETVPTHAMELPLWLERERIAHFLPVLDRQMLDLQREVVINERLQTTENRPYGRAEESLYRALFGAEHPYSWPVIGWMDDLERITLDDVRGFFERCYAPRNLVLVLAGDVGATAGFDLAEQYFGDLGTAFPAADSDSPPADVPRPQPGASRQTLPDRVSFPRTYRAHATPRYGTPDWCALDVLAYLLADGESSRLQRAVVRDAQLAQEVDTYLLPTELTGVFGVVATARNGVPIERVEERIEREIRRVVTDGVHPDEIAGAIRRIRRDQLAALGNVEDRAEALAHAATVLGDADALNGIMDGYLGVGVDEVVEAARAHLEQENGATLAVVPRAEASDAAA